MTDEHIHFDPSPASSIAGFGVQRPRFTRYVRLALPILIAAIVLFLGWRFIQTPFAIPQQTALLIAVSPNRAQSLPASSRHSLPPSWQNALVSSSRWPVVLGAWVDDGRWSTFAIMPRWRIGSGDLFLESGGIYGLISENALPASSTSFRLGDAFSWGKRWFAEARLWINPNAIMVAKEGEPATWELEPFTADIRGSIIQTDIPMAATRGVNRLSNADISANVFSETEDSGFIRDLFNEIRVGDLTLSQLPVSPLQINLFLGSDLNIRSTRLSFGIPLTQQQAALILSGFGISEQRQVALPDGSLMLTNQPIHATGTTLFAERDSARFGKVLLQEKELQFGEYAEESTQSFDNTCKLDAEWLLLSPKGVTAVAKSMGFDMSGSSTPSIRAGSFNNHLTFCLSTPL